MSSSTWWPSKARPTPRGSAPSLGRARTPAPVAPVTPAAVAERLSEAGLLYGPEGPRPRLVADPERPILPFPMRVNACGPYDRPAPALGGPFAWQPGLCVTGAHRVAAGPPMTHPPAPQELHILCSDAGTAVHRERAPSAAPAWCNVIDARAHPAQVLACLSRWLGMSRCRIVHAVAMAISGRGVLLRGPAGAGKSMLAKALVERGHQLVADDVVLLQAHGPAAFVHGPPSLAGMLACRGGPIFDVRTRWGQAAHAPWAPLTGVVTLPPPGTSARGTPAPPTPRLDPLEAVLGPGGPDVLRCVLPQADTALDWIELVEQLAAEADLKSGRA